jgi:hypothetical protein
VPLQSPAAGAIFLIKMTGMPFFKTNLCGGKLGKVRVFRYSVDIGSM